MTRRGSGSSAPTPGRTAAQFGVGAAGPAVSPLQPSSHECVGLALTLYAGILDSLEQADYQVFGVRHGFSKAKALRIAAPAYFRARRAWRS